MATINTTKSIIWNDTKKAWYNKDYSTTATTVAGATDLALKTAGASIDGRTSTSVPFILTAASSNATLYGGAGDDKLTVTAGTNLLNGGTGNDTLTGGSGKDTFEFTGAFGSDVINNISATDVVKLGNVKFADLSFDSYAANTLKVSSGVNDLTINLAASTTKNSVQFQTSDKTFVAIVSSTTSAITLAAISSAAEYVRQFGAGNATLSGGKGDTLIGGTGDDTLVYDKDVVLFNGGGATTNGHNTLSVGVTATAYTIDLNASKFANISEISVASGNTGKNILQGLANADDTLTGGGGADSLWSKGGNDKMTGGANADTFWFAAGDGVDTITDVNGADVLKFNGFKSSELAFNWDATNRLVVNYGTSGSDIVMLTGYTSGVSQDKFVTSDATFTVMAASSAATNMTGVAAKADYIQNFYAGAVTNGGTIDGQGGADTIIGGNANDTIKFYKDLALVDGGAGTNTLAVASNAINDKGVTVDLYANAAQFKNINIVTGGLGADILRGYNNSVVGETLNGAAGNDNLWSAAGSDSMIGGAGADTYWFAAGDGADTVDYTAGGAGATDKDVFNFVNVKQAALAFAYDDTNNLTVTYGSDVVTVVGSNTANFMNSATFQTSDSTFHLFTDKVSSTINGLATADLIKVNSTSDAIIDGKGGADTIIGGAGNDTITFNANAVLIDGGLGSNTLSVATGTYTPVTIDLRNTKYANIQTVNGGSGADVLQGNIAAETLNGGVGNDAIWGNKGNDTFLGGAGADTYWFTLGDGVDTIAADDTNNLDTVKLVGVTGTSAVTATINAGDLEITLADSSKLVLSQWENNAKQCNRFDFGDGKTYKLSADATKWTVA